MKKLFKSNKSGTWEYEPWRDVKHASLEMVNIFYDLFDEGYTRDQVNFMIMESLRSVDAFDSMMGQDREVTRNAIRTMTHGDEGTFNIKE